MAQTKRARQAKAIINAPVAAERDKEIAFLVAEQKLSLRAAAAQMGIPVSTVHAAYHRYLDSTRAITQERVNAYKLEQLEILDEVVHDLLSDFRKGNRDRKVLEPMGKFLHQRAMLLGLYPTNDRSAQPHNINIVFVAGDGAQDGQPDIDNVVEGHTVERTETGLERD